MSVGGDLRGGAAGGEGGKRVLILSASAGAGHVRAAEALVEDFRGHPGVADVQHWDFLKYTTQAFRYVYSQVYLDLVNHAPDVFGYVFKKTNVPWQHEKVRSAMERWNAKRFIEAVHAYGPDVIVATHFTPPNVIAWLHEQGELKVKPAIVVTDFDVHAMWLVRRYGHYFVMLEEAAAYLRKMGVPADRVTVSGIPVDRAFRRVRDKAAARAELGLPAEGQIVLVSAGGFGVGPVEVMIEELLKMDVAAHVVAIAGKSEALKKKLDRLAGKGGGKVGLTAVGFTRQMHDYMAASDLLISKPGGLTTAEAMAVGLPMVVANPIPGQEERNADHLLEAGAALRANAVATLGWKVEQLLRDEGRLARMRKAAKAFGRPDAAQVIAETVMGGEEGAKAPRH